MATMATVHKVMIEVLNIAERALNNGETATSTSSPPASTSQSSGSTNTGGNTTQSPLLFFVALGFGVVFTNLWIIVGVKYCFRYNARNRALARGEDGEAINLETVPRPHRRRREKKLMTMDEVNERFPLTKYKNWAAGRASEGLPTAGGVTSPSSRAVSLRDADGVLPSSPTDIKHFGDDRPATAASVRDAPGAPVASTINAVGGTVTDPITGTEVKRSTEVRRSLEGVEKPATVVEEHKRLPVLTEVDTAATTDPKAATVRSDEDDSEEEEDQIHSALSPDLLQNPGDTCAICIDTLEEDDDIRGLTCGHAFHAGCLDPWLTSRRACCPLCKADYFVPKPRPEGEAAEAERPNRRREGRTNVNLPQQPRSAWTGIRGGPRMIFPGRFVTPVYPGDGFGLSEVGSRGTRRARRPNNAQQPAQVPTTTDSATPTNSTGFGARMAAANPFHARWLPAIRLGGRNRRDEAAVATPAEVTPAQLESGTVVR